MLIGLKLNTQGINELLTGPEVNADLQARAERVQAAASAHMQDPTGMTVVEAGDSKRARYIVITTNPEAMQGEMKDRRLTRAIDAAR
jgi:hypothetical protein